MAELRLVQGIATILRLETQINTKLRLIWWFPKIGLYPVIIHFSRWIFHKPASLGYPKCHVSSMCQVAWIIAAPRREVVTRGTKKDGWTTLETEKIATRKRKTWIAFCWLIPIWKCCELWLACKKTWCLMNESDSDMKSHQNGKTFWKSQF